MLQGWQLIYYQEGLGKGPGSEDPVFKDDSGVTWLSLPMTPPAT